MSTDTPNTSDEHEASEESEDWGLPEPARKAGLRSGRLKQPALGQRTNTVRLLFPKGPDTDLRDDIDGALVRTIEEVARTVESIEILMHNGPNGLVVVIHPAPYRIDERSMNQVELDSFQDGVCSGPQRKVLDAVERNTNKLGIEIGSLDLQPVGVSPITTTRLLKKEQRTVGHIGKHNYNPLAVTLKALKKYSEPFIYQVIVKENKKRYNISARLALCHPRHNYNGTQGFGELGTGGHNIDLADVYSPYGLTTNYHLPVEDYFQISGSSSRSQQSQRKYRVQYLPKKASRYKSMAEVVDEADTIRQLTLGKDEWRGLKNGDASINKGEYEGWDYYSWFNVVPAQLPLFVPLVDLGLENNPWKRLDAREPPEYTTSDIIRKADGQKQSVDKNVKHAPKTTANVQNEGKAMHRSLNEFTKNWFAEQGDNITKIDQTTESLPDLRLNLEEGEIKALNKTVDNRTAAVEFESQTKTNDDETTTDEEESQNKPSDDDTVAVEVESKNSTKPASTLTNAKRAINNEEYVIFVYPDKKTAARGLNHLKQPYREVTPVGVRWYNDGKLECTDGRNPVVRGSADETEATWETNPDGEHTLTVNDEVIVNSESGPISELTYDCPRLVEKDDTYVVESVDCDVIEEYSSPVALRDEWTRIARPHIPLVDNYLPHAMVMHRDGDELKEYQQNPSWRSELDNLTKKMERYELVMEKFVSRQVIKHEGGKIYYEEFQNRFQRFYEHELDREPPKRNVIGKVLPDELKEAKTAGTDNNYQYFDDYEWVPPVKMMVSEQFELEE